MNGSDNWIKEKNSLVNEDPLCFFIWAHSSVMMLFNHGSKHWNRKHLDVIIISFRSLLRSIKTVTTSCVYSHAKSQTVPSVLSFSASSKRRTSATDCVCEKLWNFAKASSGVREKRREITLHIFSREPLSDKDHFLPSDIENIFFAGFSLKL